MLGQTGRDLEKTKRKNTTGRQNWVKQQWNKTGERKETDNDQCGVDYEPDNEQHTATCTRVDNDDEDNMDTQQPEQCPHAL